MSQSIPITLLPSQRVSSYTRYTSGKDIPTNAVLYIVEVKEKSSNSILNSYHILRELNGNWIEFYKDCDDITFIEIKEAIEKSEIDLANVEKANIFLGK